MAQSAARTCATILMLVAASATANDWERHAPGGRTLCADGSAFHFYTRAGDPEKLLFYLRGGGGCSSRQYCDPDMTPTYRRNAGGPPGKTGIFETSNSDNPLADHTVVFVPYCTGDVHIGNVDREYPPVEAGQAPLVIPHRGFENVASALRWTTSNLNPDDIFVAGSSAGAIPSPFYAARLARLYPDARVAQLGDGGGGYRSEGSSAENDAWNAISALSTEPGFEGMTPETFQFALLYSRAAARHPNVMFTQYDAAEDSVQRSFIRRSGRDASSLLANLRANHADIRASGAANFASFVAGGESHTILGRQLFYQFAAGSQGFQEWVTDLVHYRPLQSHSCADCRVPDFTGVATPKAMKDMWAAWESPDQAVAPFRIFDNVYYVGIDWVAAYAIDTSEGIILIDSLYGRWTNQLMNNMRKVGLDPRDTRYVIATHGHFDHAGGAAAFQRRFGARVVMAAEDWALAAEPPGHPLYAMPVPKRDFVAEDGDTVTLGDTTIELFKTPGHTKGVLTMRYEVRDGDDTHLAMTLGGVGLNFSGVDRTRSYVSSYKRLRKLARGVSVSLPNHASMGRVFERGAELAHRQAGEAHPFVDRAALQSDLKRFLAGGRQKLKDERKLARKTE